MKKKRGGDNYNGRISDQLAVQYDLLTLAKMLSSFKETPDPQKAQELRKIAMSSSMKVLELIKTVMDKMSDPLCKFLLPAGILSANDSLEEL